MDFWQAVVMIVFFSTAGNVLREFAKSWGSGGQVSKQVLVELQQLRAEIKQLKQQNNDVILSLDTAIHRVEQRVTRIDAPSETVPAGRR